MTTLPGRSLAFVQPSLCLLLWLVLATDTYAQPDITPHAPERVLFIGHLNFDCLADTVTGAAGPGVPVRYLPRTIRWGRPALQVRYDSLQAHRDTVLADSSCLGAIPLSRRVAVTTIHYPAWENFSGSVAFNRMNPDSLDDMLLYLWGTVGDEADRHDTLRPLLIFGQQGLDTLPVLDVTAIDAFQVAPFFAMELRKGSELVEPEMRDLSGVTSYVLQPVSLDVDLHPQDTLDPPSPGDSTPAHPIRVRVFPNPTGIAAQLEVASIPAGEYSVEVVGVNGLVYLQQTVSVAVTGALFQTLDLHTLPTGYYLVRVTSAGQLFALYPIIITR